MIFLKRNKLNKSLLIAASAITVPFVVNITQAEAGNVTYNDFNKSAYWAKDMQWMNDNGLLTGYVNQKHPSTGKHGNWLDPNGKLTEYQMLSVLLRYEMGLDAYKDFQAQEQAKPNKPFVTSEHYVKAKELGIVTKGSATNGKYSTKQVTRGQLAQALVSLYYGKSVTINEAVDFMFENGITTGKEPSKGKTMSNFGANDNLSRAHISAFVKRFDDAQNRGIADTLNKEPSSPADITKPVEPTDSVDKGDVKDPIKNTGDRVSLIQGKSLTTAGDFTKLANFKQKTGTPDVTGAKVKTKYGERSYLTTSQADYDKLMSVLGSKNYPSFGSYMEKARQTSPSKDMVEMYDYYINGGDVVLDTNVKEYYELKNRFLLGIHDAVNNVMFPVNSVEDLVTIPAITGLVQAPSSYSKYSLPSISEYSGYSALSLVEDGASNCVTASYLVQAVLDKMDLDSVVIHSPQMVHAYNVVYLNGKWLNMEDGLKEYKPLERDYILYAPVGGKDIMTSAMQKMYKPFN